ncbi:hypothetical protein [Wenxinia marina]|uniref:Calcium-binding protein n=1 Tax=Wenxinia marina DSM 24838 TaxID=1123501 RepID=A0A0D0PHP8_9RHOB|nr:hypothetical protein [Wenxinia marina]KIQ70916.1 hypothetical protein Wenmar_00290 [Wenxinia marina DSM 24838]GGL56302.1 hypothetical protein GCM10011392_08470 [Wenxinia marina]
MRLRDLVFGGLAALSLSLAGSASAQDLRLFFFGNSLVHHLTDSDETTVPHWLAFLARAEGERFGAEGQWGFLHDFADVPPEPQWTFGRVERVWRSNRLPFGEVGWDGVVLTPPNFIQYQPANRPLDGDNPGGETPLELGAAALGWAAEEAPDAPLFVYEGWADMGPWGFPPDAEGWAEWLEFNAGPFHDWNRLYATGLTGAVGREVRVIPTARVLAGLLQGPLAELPPEALFSDDAPHGTPTLYFLASLVTWAAVTDTPPPAAASPPPGLNEVVRARYPEIATEVWLRLTAPEPPPEEARAPEPEAEVVEAAAAPDVPEPPATGLADPAIGFGLAGIADWATQVPFVDLMKTARPWLGHTDEGWGAVSFEDLQAGGHLSPEGWPVSIPGGVTALETFVLTDLPAGAVSLIGRYRMDWTGEGVIEVGGLAFDKVPGDHQVAFSYVPGEGPVVVRITALDPEDPIRDIRIYRENEAELLDLGEVFNPRWIARIADARQVRFMDWMRTNGSPQATWDDRPRESDFSWAWRGVPLPVMLRLANEIGADPWFTLPHMADDAYVAAFATAVREGLRPDLVATAEWSNEVWNWIFPQAAWARDRAVERWGEDAGDDAWMQYAGLRASEVADIWGEVFAGQEDRIQRVVAVHTGWPGLEEGLLGAPLAVAEGRAPPAGSFDAYAVSGYFGLELGGERADETRAAMRQGNAAEWAETALAEGSLAVLTDELWPYHAQVAQAHGLDLVMYEGGTHVVGLETAVEDEGLTAFFIRFNYSAAMAELYETELAAWDAIGDGPFQAFVDVAAPSKWGSWGALRHLDDANPRWAALALRNGEGFGDPRGGAFRQGAWIRGDGGDERIEGTELGDLILAGPGDDVIVAGPGDRVHGGPGADRVELPGTAAEVVQSWDGEALVLTAPWGVVRVASVGVAAFADGTELPLMEEGDGA